MLAYSLKEWVLRISSSHFTVQVTFPPELAANFLAEGALIGGE
ncbi:hypothetical protein [Acaryochloris sp. IP29b_bin.148]|nr:hypothetical protein [Acaryochloris sp. IP29b_bin.148]